MRHALLACVAIAALPAAAAEKSAEAHIPFANSGGIRDWRALDDKSLFVQGTDRQWYHATLFSSCFGLSTTHNLAFVTSPPDGSFDRFSSLLVEGSRCPVVSLVKSDPPPGEKPAGEARAGKKK